MLNSSGSSRILELPKSQSVLVPAPGDWIRRCGSLACWQTSRQYHALRLEESKFKLAKWKRKRLHHPGKEADRGLPAVS